MTSIRMARLDVISVRPHWFSFVALPVLIILFTLQSSDPFVPMITGAWMAMMLVSVIFAVQEQNHLAKLYATLPLSGTSTVIGRYLSSLLLFFVSVVLALLAISVRLLITAAPLVLSDVVLAMGLAWVMFAVVCALQLPLYFTFGYAKARILALVPFPVLALLAFVPAVQDFIGRAANSVSWEGPGPVLVFIAVGCAALLLSAALAVRLYQRQKNSASHSDYRHRASTRG